VTLSLGNLFRVNIRDHKFFGEDYVARLFMQNPTTAQALLAGCWRIFGGQFFDI
jgi:hypothetical protein